MNNSSNSSVVIAVGKCKKKNKKKKRPSPCNKDTSLFTIDHRSTYKKFYQKGTFPLSLILRKVRNLGDNGCRCDDDKGN